MTGTRSLPRKLELPPAQDWAFLREQGLAYIQQLSGQVWTDHNTHDPGITLLEILAYALTDLAYRTRFETRDLLAAPDGRTDPAEVSGLFPAHEVLTTGPRTLADYRRLLLRIEGVRNAWLDPMTDPADADNYRLSEVPLYADCLTDSLSYRVRNAAGEDNRRLRLSGLYRVLVELEIDDLLGSLNESALDYRVRRGPLKGVVVRFQTAIAEVVGDAADLSADPVGVRDVSVSQQSGMFHVAATLDLDDGSNRVIDPGEVRVIEDRPRFDRDAIEVTSQALRGVLLDATADGLLPLFWLKQQRRANAIAAVGAVLHANRGLCEDFLSVATVAPHRVGVCADIEVGNDADLERVQATVFRAIEKYLSPPVPYRTLSDLLAAGETPDRIFNGPFIDYGFEVDGEAVFTKPGFITDDDLDATQLRRKVYGSDLINAIVDIDGVDAVRNLQLRVYGDDGRVSGESEAWVLDVPGGHQAVFHTEGSKLLFHRAGVPFRAQPTEFERTLKHLRALDRHEVYVDPDQVLPVPVGRWRQTDAFYSVQHDLPEIYKVGEAGISAAESPQRIAQARQLKAYLTFFDQLLGDYLGQLGNLRRLYAIDPAIDSTWFPPFIDGIAGSLGTFADEFYVDKAALQDDTTRVRLNESEEAFLDRRNRLLDQLVARFAERFSDYALTSYRSSADRMARARAAIDDKIAFLKVYPRLSRNRGQAANMRPQDPARIWDSDNVSGLERRAGRLLGLDQVLRRDLHCAGHFDALFTTRKSANRFRLEIRDRDGKQLLQSEETFANRATALQRARRLYPRLRSEEAYVISASEGTTTWQLRLVAGTRSVTHSSAFDTEKDAVIAARAIVDRYDELLESDLCDVPGMHLVEHILLRPRADGDPLLGVCLGDDCMPCGDEDPYSFRATVVLPYWPQAFRDVAFRGLVERTLREQAPAHVQLKICWLSQAQMSEFDAAYKSWLTATAATPTNAGDIRTAVTHLVAVIDALRSVYPAAALHDCDIGEGDNPVRLGASALGIF